MSAGNPASVGEDVAARGALHAAVDKRTLAILESRRNARSVRRRGWLVRRTLVIADMIGLAAAFLVAQLVLGSAGEIDSRVEFLAFLVTLPGWVVVARLYGLYDHDEERTDHSTADEFLGVFHLVTVGAWLLFAVTWLTGLVEPNLAKLFVFWGLAIGLVAVARVGARSYSRRQLAYLQNAVIVGAGEVGQRIGRKLLHHPEYGINLVGFIDAAPKEWRADLASVPVLGTPEELPDIICDLDVERVIIAFSGDSHERTLDLIRALKSLNIQVDIVPRLFEAVGPNVGIHTLEGVPLVGLPPARPARAARLVKRTIDVVGALVLLLLTAPLFAYVAWRIKADSPGPVFFRQVRLGMNMRPFTLLKFRTMKLGTDESDHREYVRAAMDTNAAPEAHGLFKLERGDAVTRVGRWLRSTSLDELPQLINVLRGDMSLVGPRPCLAYETEQFAPHHFERFLTPAGLTGLWQVTARAHSTFFEALEMDVAYTRGWSLGLDLSLLFRTPLQFFRRTGTA